MLHEIYVVPFLVVLSRVTTSQSLPLQGALCCLNSARQEVSCFQCLHKIGVPIRRLSLAHMSLLNAFSTLLSRSKPVQRLSLFLKTATSVCMGLLRLDSEICHEPCVIGVSESLKISKAFRACLFQYFSTNHWIIGIPRSLFSLMCAATALPKMTMSRGGFAPSLLAP
jgi:hypothetical protein